MPKGNIKEATQLVFSLMFDHLAWSHMVKRKYSYILNKAAASYQLDLFLISLRQAESPTNTFPNETRQDSPKRPVWFSTAPLSFAPTTLQIDRWHPSAVPACCVLSSSKSKRSSSSEPSITTVLPNWPSLRGCVRSQFDFQLWSGCGACEDTNRRTHFHKSHFLESGF